jgi:hypothetical protein
MKKLIIAALIAAASHCAMAAAFEVHVKMPDGKILVFEQAAAPGPDKDGMYRLKANGKLIVVHASNVWFIKK